MSPLFFESLAVQTLGYPILTAKRDQRDVEAVRLEIGFENDRDPVAAASVSNQPAIKRPIEAHSGPRIGYDVGNERIDLIKPTHGRAQIALRDCVDVLGQSAQIAPDQGGAYQLHQRLLPLPAGKMESRWFRASLGSVAQILSGIHLANPA
ncbi:hypothetical protein ACTTAL_18925 (plasmid) [Rhodobacter capsulatus]